MVFTFIGKIILANRELPYNDFHTDTTKATYGSYAVGENNRQPNADQTKLFVSKSTLIIATTTSHVKFNSAKGVVHTLIANNFYEFKSNIHSIHYAYVAEAGVIWIHCEGVLPQEARRAK